MVEILDLIFVDIGYLLILKRGKYSLVAEIWWKSEQSIDPFGSGFGLRAEIGDFTIVIF